MSFPSTWSKIYRCEFFSAFVANNNSLTASGEGGCLGGCFLCKLSLTSWVRQRGIPESSCCNNLCAAFNFPFFTRLPNCLALSSVVLWRWGDLDRCLWMTLPSASKVDMSPCFQSSSLHSKHLPCFVVFDLGWGFLKYESRQGEGYLHSNAFHSSA